MSSLVCELSIRLAEHRITDDQVSSFSWDGVYFHCSVDKLVREKMGRTEESLPCNHDWMHCCGLVDSHLCSRKEFKWVNKIVKIYQHIYHKVCKLEGKNFSAKCQFANGCFVHSGHIFLIISVYVGVTARETDGGSREP